LRPGEHLCLFYETPEEHRAALTAFMRQGLVRGDKVMCVTGDDPRGRAPEDLLNYLRDDGQGVGPYLERGQLVVHARDEAHLQRLASDPAYASATLRAETERALAEGFKALRFTSETPWLQEPSASRRVAVYAAQLNEFLQGSRCLLLCQYDQRRLAPEILLDALHAHPATVVDDAVYDNFYYVPPAELLSQDASAAELRRRIGNLIKFQRTEEKFRAYREQLELLKRQSLCPPASSVVSRAGRNPELALLNRVGQSLNKTRDSERVLTTILEVARRLLDVFACAAWLKDAQTSELVCRYVTGPYGDAMRGQRLAWGQGLVGQVAQSGECLILPDARADAQYQESGRPALRSILGVPLWVNANVVGVIQVMDTQAARFDHADLALVKSLALSAAAVIENAWLYREAKTLQAFNENILRSLKKNLAYKSAVGAGSAPFDEIAEPWAA
jgi:putative methionine-R-sulfoxide reductase with GAF domain